MAASDDVEIISRPSENFKRRSRRSSFKGIKIKDSEDDDLVVLSDAEYAFELQLKETLYATNNNIDRKPNKAKKDRVLVQCNICLEEKDISKLFPGLFCDHSYCTSCIRLHIKTKVSEKSLPIECPEPDCKEQLRFESCQGIVPWKVAFKWSEALTETAIPEFQKLYCPYKDCSALLVNDYANQAGVSSLSTFDNTPLTYSKCPWCNRACCASCKVPWHEGMSCADVEALPSSEKESGDIMLFKLAKENDWQRCTKCRHVIEKSTGCAHMVCKCGYQFCYYCGAEWRNKAIPCNCTCWREN